jgi:hypothetical protein
MRPSGSPMRSATASADAYANASTGGHEHTRLRSP